MDAPVLFFISLALMTCVIIHLLISSFIYRRLGRLPPGPYSIPIIGNILQLGKNPNQSLAKLSKTYGPLMSLKLGTRTTIVVSSPTIAREILQKNDLVFSSRTIPCAAHASDHHKFSMAWLPVSTQWRILRKISREHMFTVQRLDASQELRQDKLKELGQYLHTCCVAGEAIEIGEAVFTTTLNLMSNTIFSSNIASFDSSNLSQELKKNVCEFNDIVAESNIADYFPLLSYIDPQGILRKSKHSLEKIFDTFEHIIKKRLQERRTQQNDYVKRQDLLETLLDQMEKEDDSNLNMDDIKHLLLDLFIAGPDTTSVSIEWGMTELLRNPEKMAKARAELVEIIGQKKAAVEESDISKLPYLQAIVNETFRLHPAAPLLLPRKADANVEINGYTVPKDAYILINVWAIGRDSGTWSEPEKFIPERFLESEVDVRGQHFELIPFGGGRRICPGLPLAYRMVHLVLAFIIHNFEWKLPQGITAEDVDMEEQFGVSVHKTIPLKAIPMEL